MLGGNNAEGLDAGRLGGLDAWMLGGNNAEGLDAGTLGDLEARMLGGMKAGRLGGKDIGHNKTGKDRRGKLFAVAVNSLLHAPCSLPFSSQLPSIPASQPTLGTHIA